MSGQQLQVTGTESGGGAAETRRRELEAGRLVVRAARRAVEQDGAGGFLARRAAASVAELASGAARQSLGRAASELLEARRSPELARALVCWGGVLEAHALHEAAAEAYEAALRVDAVAETALHAARARRRAGDADAARSLYDRVRGLCRGDVRLCRYAHLGEALLAPDAERALSVRLREFVRAGDAEAAAVAQEERARLRRARGAHDAALRDYGAAALRYGSSADRVRLANAMADLLLSRGAVDAAREALSVAMELAEDGQRAYVVDRLRTVARLQGDQLTLRRWRDEPTARLAVLVPAAPARARAALPARRRAVLRRWRDGLTGARATA